ncbi:MAG TPA: GAF domain-containing sensor histidine kinase, partial [Allocoleopsis sp.]
QLTHADGATFLRDRDQCYYADEDAISPLWKGGRFPMSACISGWVMLNQQSVVIEDIYADPRIPADAYRPTFVKSLAMVPIRTRDPLGAIGNYWATHHTPTPEEMNLLQTLADAAAVALENVHLYEEQEQRIQERTVQLQRALDFEALLQRITDKVRDSLDGHQILATVVQELTKELALSRCNTTLYNLEQATASVCYEYTSEFQNHSTPDSRHTHFTVGCRTPAAMAEFSELYTPLLRGETLQFCCLPSNQPDSTLPSLVLVCPIVDDHSLLGDIRLYRTATEPFTEPEIRLVQQVANQCAIALRQARLHEAVQAQVQGLERLHQLKDDFLSTVSHELRTPMTNIKMAVQMLQAVLGISHLNNPFDLPAKVTLNQANTAKAIRYLQVLNQECQREINLVTDLLDVIHLKADLHPDSLQDVVLQTWLPQVAEPFREQTRRRRQQLQIQISDQLPPLKTDPAILERILTELLQNACKYTPPGETITVAARMHDSDPFSLERSFSSPAFWLTVSNSGVEISDRDRPFIFDKFYRIPNHDPWKTRGTGLGLALVKRLVEQLSGSIEVSSTHNLVCFTVKLLP